MYHRLRILDTAGGTKAYENMIGLSPKTHIIYTTGLSPNTYLGPVGIGATDHHRYQDTTTGVAKISDSCRRYVTERARLSSSLFGRKVQQASLQELNPSSVLRGQAACVFKCEGSRSETCIMETRHNNTARDSTTPLSKHQRKNYFEDSGTPTKKKHSLVSCRQMGRVPSESDKFQLSQRPYSVGRLSHDYVRCLNSARQNAFKIQDEKAFFKVQQIIQAKPVNASNDSPQRKPLVNGQTLRKDFAAINELRRNLEENLLDLPPGLYNHLQKTINDSSKSDAIKTMENNNNNNRLQNRKSGILLRRKMIQQSQYRSLKPLLYDEELDQERAEICHDSHCGNCFHAYLAPNDCHDYHDESEAGFRSGASSGKRSQRNSSRKPPTPINKMDKSECGKIEKAYGDVEYIAISTPCC